MNIASLDEKLKNCSKEEREAVLKILQEYRDTGTSSTLFDMKYIDFDEIPVDITTFIHDRKYLGNALYDPEGRFTVFPYWEEKLKDIFPDNITTKYNTIIFTGAIGLGKSTIAVIILLYLLYRLLCLKDPYLYYGMQPIDKISISLMNITIDNAKGVALDKMNQMILASSWFLAHGEMHGDTNLTYVPEKHIELITASSNNQVIGRAIFGNFSDEVNWGLTNDTEKLKKKYKELVSQIDARMKSRFMRTKPNGDTYLPTVNIIASSKNSEQSFLDDYINTKKKNESKNTLIVDEPQWVVDSRKDNKVKFYVAIGNKFLANELLPLTVSQEELSLYRNKGYSILAVPIGYYENFQDNLDGALKDIAGIASQSTLKYISGVKWAAVKTDTYRNPFTREIIEVGTNDDIPYSDFFDLSRVPVEMKAKPMFVHLDMSKSGDKTGISGVWVIGKRPKVEGKNDSRELFYKIAFNVSVKAPRGFEISFDKNRQFVRWLRDQGFKIKGVSADTYQSAQIGQQLIADKFNFKTISMDRVDTQSGVCLPYAYFQSTLYERRLQVYSDCDFLTEEVLGLEKLSNGKIEHPEAGTQGCFTGDTKVSLVDGRELTFLELIDEYNQGKENYVYSFNETTKKIEPKPIVKAWCTRKDAELMEIELDSGEVIQCTPNHKFMLRDGVYCEAKDLLPGDSLMPLYRKYPNVESNIHNYRMYYEPIEDKWHYEHRQFAEEVLDEKYLVHHKNCNSKDNTPTNLVWCSKQKHQEIHKEMQTGAHSEEAKKKRSNSIKEWYQDDSNKDTIEEKRQKLHKARLNQIGWTEEDFLKRRDEEKQKHLNGLRIKEQAGENKRKKEDYISSIEKTFNIKWDELSNNERDGYAVKYQRMQNPETQEKISKAISENHKSNKYENAYKELRKCNEESKLLKKLIPSVDKDRFRIIFGFEYDSIEPAKRASWTVKYRRIVGKTILNHKVKSIRFIDKREDVYDIEVKDNHNFALSCGVFVHNSKDAIDAVVGSLYHSLDYADEYAYDYGEEIPDLISANKNMSEDIREQLVVDWNAAMKEALGQSYLNKRKEEDKEGLLKYNNIEDSKEVDTSSMYYAGSGIYVW